MTVQQLINSLLSIPEEYRGATVWQSVIDGRCETREVIAYLHGQLSDGEDAVVILRPDVVNDLCPVPDLCIVPGIPL